MAESAPLQAIVETSLDVAQTSSRLGKIARLATLLRALGPAEAPLAVAWLSGELRQNRLGIGAAALHHALGATPAERSGLDIAHVDAAFTRLAALSGRGSSAARAAELGALFARATRDEQQFLAALLGGGLRQGALQGVMQDALARAADVSVAAVRRAAMLAGDLPAIAAAAFTGGKAALAAFDLQLFRPLQPMLADSADDVEDALETLGEGALEYKLDGARVQVHRSGDDVRVYTRNLNDVTASVPEIVEATRSLDVRDVILDGEVIAFAPNGMPHPFQITMRRFGRRIDIATLRQSLPLRASFFDALRVDGQTLLDRPGHERFAALESVAPDLLVPRIVTDDPARAAAFLAQARSAGHEGLVAKALDAIYEAGRRGSAWLKVKPVHTLDLVVLAVEWGSGRRKGWLSNLHLGARNPEDGGFVMLGKTFKGLTDALLQWQTRELLAREIARDEWTVYVRPELVVEVAFNNIQTSPRYPAGLALRFARVKRYRPDKRAGEADTIETVRAIYAASLNAPGSAVSRTMFGAS